MDGSCSNPEWSGWYAVCLDLPGAEVRNDQNQDPHNLRDQVRSEDTPV